MTNPGLYGFPKATGARAKIYPPQEIDLVVDYDVHWRNNDFGNYEAITAAFAAAKDLFYNGGPTTKLLLRTGADIYQTKTLTLPAAPITIEGQGTTPSILGTTDGTLITYDTASPIPSAVAQQWSYSWRGIDSPPGTVDRSGPGVAYQSNVWQLRNLGLTKSDGWHGNTGNGLYFPKWTAGVSYQQLVLWMQDCVISNFNGTSATHAGLYHIISGGNTDAYFHNVTVANCSARGIYMGSDSRMVNVTAHSNGEEGLYCDSYIWQALGIKSWGNGQNKTAGKQSGVYMNGPPAACHLTNVYTQDNNGPGVTFHNAGRISMFGVVSDRNNWYEEASGVLVQDSHHVIVHGYDSTDSKNMARTTVSGANALNSSTINVVSTAGFTVPSPPLTATNLWIDNTLFTYTAISGNSFTGCTNHPAYLGTEIVSSAGAQLHALKVTNTGGTTNNSNYIQLVHTQYDVGYLVGAAVDASSDLSGTRVVVGESFTGASDSSPASVEFVQAGASVTVNRKFFPNAAGGIFLGSGATLRIL